MFERALEIQLKIKNDLGVAINFNNLGAVAEKQGNYKKAIEYYNKSNYYEKKNLQHSRPGNQLRIHRKYLSRDEAVRQGNRTL
jgi:tetratricopeptide (TPR) repeat protein